MSKETYIQAVKDLCTLIGHPEPARLVNGAPLMLNDIAFSLIYSAEINPSCMFIYCDFGEVPQEKALQVYQALLRLNMYLYTGYGPNLSLSEASNRVTLAYCQSLQNIDATALKTLLEDFSQQAKEWRASYYLEGETGHCLEDTLNPMKGVVRV